jgi:Ca2+-binding RTX toxin-like protein
VFIAGSQGTFGDTVAYTSRDDDVTARIGAPAASNTDGDNISSTVDHLAGGDGDDTLTGDGDPNRLNGDDGDDLLMGGIGTGADSADIFEGGPHGTVGDTVSYATRTQDLDVDLDNVDDDGHSCPGAGCELDDIRTDVENVTGGAGDDDLAGNGVANILDGGGGDDDFIASASTGPDGADTFIGGGDSTVGGQNLERKDRLFFDDRLDPLVVDIGGGANDTDGDDVRPDIESLFGGEGGDTLTGDGDANAIDGREGADTIAGGQGTGPDGADELIGGTGTDTLTYAAKTTGLDINLETGVGPDGDDLDLAPEIVIGGAANDSITGDGSANTLDGGPGSDDLFGLGGADTLFVRDGGPDTADCGADVDSVTADTPAQDELIDCETADTLPDTRITSRPNDRITRRSARYEFESDEASQFECKIDARPFSSCESPKRFRNLSLGRHVVKVRAVDAEGDKDPRPAKDVFKVVRA